MADFTKGGMAFIWHKLESKYAVFENLRKSECQKVEYHYLVSPGLSHVEV